MSRWSVVVDGKIENLKFRFKVSHGGGSMVYSVFLDEKNLGTVSKFNERSGWMAFSLKDFDTKVTQEQADRLAKYGQVYEPEQIRAKDPMRAVNGFGTRRAAAEYIIKHHGLREHREEW